MVDQKDHLALMGNPAAPGQMVHQAQADHLDQMANLVPAVLQEHLVALVAKDPTVHLVMRDPQVLLVQLAEKETMASLAAEGRRDHLDPKLTMDRMEPQEIPVHQAHLDHPEKMHSIALAPQELANYQWFESSKQFKNENFWSYFLLLTSFLISSSNVLM